MELGHKNCLYIFSKNALTISCFQQSTTIKVLETKTGILEQQLDEMKNKETAYVDQKTKFQELEQKYSQCLSQWHTSQASCLGNTPPLSQHKDSYSAYQILPLHYKLDPDNSKTFSIRASSGPGYGNFSWKAGQTNNQYNLARNNPLPTGPMGNADVPVKLMVNPNLPSNPQVNTNPVANSSLPHVVTYVSSLPYSTTPQAGSIINTAHPQITMSCQPPQANQPYSTPSYSTSTHCCKVRYTGTC